MVNIIHALVSYPKKSLVHYSVFGSLTFLEPVGNRKTVEYNLIYSCEQSPGISIWFDARLHIPPSESDRANNGEHEHAEEAHFQQFSNVTAYLAIDIDAHSFEL